MPANSLEFSVTGASESPTRLAVSARDFAFFIDEPPSFGGTDAGPNPLEYALAALAGCMNIVIHMIVKERGIELRALTLTVKGELDPSLLMGKPTENRSGFQEIVVIADIDSDASAAELDEVLRLSELRCPVSDNLSDATPVVVRRATTSE